MSADRFRALFDPRGVLVAGASTHPGKFGFVALHNILACGYGGKVYASNREGAEVLGVRTVPDVADLPDGEIDLVFVCTPAAANPDLLRACAKKGITAAFIASAGYGEAGDDGVETTPCPLGPARIMPSSSASATSASSARRPSSPASP